ncbi:MAG TPA: hypothetical protein VF618_23605 [Thermoanaerobaculia bacterium]
MTEPEEHVDHDDQGRIRQRYHLRAGQLHGELIRYDEDGRVEAVMPYLDGKLEGEGHFFDRGRLQLKVGYRNGLQDGETVVFGENGKPTMRSHYRAGRLDGQSSWYRPDGSLMRTAEFIDGNPDGPPVEYDERGRVRR